MLTNKKPSATAAGRALAAICPATVAAAAPMGDPGGFPTGDGPIDLTPEQQACLIEAVENSSLPDMPKGFIIPALERGTISDPSRMAGLKERAGIDLDSCFPPSLPVAG